MRFLTLEDETGLLEGVVLPAAYPRVGERVITPGPVMVAGVLVRRQGAVHLEVTDLTPFRDRPAPFRRGSEP